ncbi:MAG: sugar phosphate isomerase/epimerase [Massilibacteroides sp.]|nr:sugar phosphate isomerase/epimerase [Massilibacteroides sp.]
MNNRRKFIKQGLAGSALLLSAPQLISAALTPSATSPTAEKPTPKANPFHFGMAGWTLHKFDVDTALAFTEKIDMHYFCIKNFQLPFDADEETIRTFKAKLAAHHLTGYGVGPIYMKTEKAIDDAFDYAERIGGIKVIVAVPSYELLPYLDKKMKNYDFKIAIHLHGPDQKIFQDATVVWNHTKDLNPNIGMCLDVGHDLRNGSDPVKDVLRYHSRIFDMHIKDVTACDHTGKGIEFGRGKIDFAGLIKALRKVNYTGCCNIEYEKNMDDPFIEIGESVGYFRALMDNI